MRRHRWHATIGVGLLALLAGAGCASGDDSPDVAPAEGLELLDTVRGLSLRVPADFRYHRASGRSELVLAWDGYDDARVDERPAAELLFVGQPGAAPLADVLAESQATAVEIRGGRPDAVAKLVGIPDLPLVRRGELASRVHFVSRAGTPFVSAAVALRSGPSVLVVQLVAPNAVFDALVSAAAPVLASVQLGVVATFVPASDLRDFPLPAYRDEALGLSLHHLPKAAEENLWQTQPGTFVQWTVAPERWLEWRLSVSVEPTPDGAASWQATAREQALASGAELLAEDEVVLGLAHGTRLDLERPVGGGTPDRIVLLLVPWNGRGVTIRVQMDAATYDRALSPAVQRVLEGIVFDEP